MIGKQLEKSDGFDGLLAIADLLDDPKLRSKIIPTLKRLAPIFADYRQRVANCLRMTGATDDEVEKICEANKGDEIFRITRDINS